MRTLTILAVLAAAPAQGQLPRQTLSLTCHQQITTTGTTLQGRQLPPQHSAATVAYVLDFAKPSLSVRSRVGATTFTEGTYGQHIIVDPSGMTMAGTNRLGHSGPVVSQIIRFTADGTRGASERKLLIDGKVVQLSDTRMTCNRSR